MTRDDIRALGEIDRLDKALQAVGRANRHQPTEQAKPQGDEHRQRGGYTGGV